MLPISRSESLATFVVTVYTGTASNTAFIVLSDDIVIVVSASVETVTPVSSCHSLNAYPKFFFAVSFTSLPSLYVAISGSTAIVPAPSGVTEVVSTYLVDCAAAPTRVPVMTTLESPIDLLLPNPKKENFSFKGLSAVAVTPLTSFEKDAIVRPLLPRLTPWFSTKACDASPASTTRLMLPLSVP